MNPGRVFIWGEIYPSSEIWLIQLEDLTGASMDALARIQA